jgi:hypothetical protein
MHDWLGWGLIALGLGLMVSAVFKRRSRSRMVVAAGQLRPEFAAMGEIVRPMILGFVGLFAAKMSLYYFLLGGQKYLTQLDYGGLMFVLAAYAGWLVAATSKRPQQAAATQATPEPSGMRSAA